MAKQEFNKKELENSNRIFKSATPKYELSWYIKWASSFFILISMSMRGIPEYNVLDVCFSLICVAGWLVLGILWKDRALVLLNGVGVALLIRNLLEVI